MIAVLRRAAARVFQGARRDEASAQAPLPAPGPALAPELTGAVDPTAATEPIPAAAPTQRASAAGPRADGQAEPAGPGLETAGEAAPGADAQPAPETEPGSQPEPEPEPEPEPPPPWIAEQQLAHGEWLACEGDQTLRQEYSIAVGEVVVDLGGYQGQWASDIYARYRPKVFVFEPVPEFADRIRKRFQDNPDVHVVEAAVASADGRMRIGVAADASSSFGDRKDLVDVPVLDFVAWWRAAGCGEIALLKINIEGGEYELLEHLVASGAVRDVREIQVQFHFFVPEAEARMRSIQAQLAATHERTYAFKWIWENWRRLPSTAVGEAWP